MRNESIVGESFIKFCPQHALSGHSTITLTFKDFFGFRKPNIWISTYCPGDEVKVAPHSANDGHFLCFLHFVTPSLFQQSQSSSSRLLGPPLVSDHTVSRYHHHIITCHNIISLLMSPGRIFPLLLVRLPITRLRHAGAWLCVSPWPGSPSIITSRGRVLQRR